MKIGFNYNIYSNKMSVQNTNFVTKVKNTNLLNEKCGKNKNVSFKSYYDDDNYWEDSPLDKLRDHFLYGIRAYECVKEPPFQIFAKDLSENDIQKLDFNYNDLKSLKLNNFTILKNKKGVRGSCIVEGYNFKYINDVKNAGIERIIDLREIDNSAEIYKICNKYGLEYFNFPISYNMETGQENIDKLPELLELINQGKIYIGCEEGINRTDMTLAINYLFNPKEKVIPDLESASPSKILEYTQDFANSIFSNESFDKKEFAESLGWKDYISFENEYCEKLSKLLSKYEKRK